MICIINPCLDPYFNLSCEEYLLKFFTEECFMLWRNSPSIIVGKHQNPMAEINHDFVNTNNIPVIRRLSGGGAVYHDLGNINFTFVTNNITHNKINFPLFLYPIIDLLHKLGIKAILNSRNNLFIGDKKISGTAAHLAKNRVLHHGTILFNSSLNYQHQALDNNSQNYSDKSVRSVHSVVTNIYDHLIEKIDIVVFMKLIEKKIKTEFNITSDFSFREEDIKNAEYIAEKKYKLREWNYGYSPA